MSGLGNKEIMAKNILYYMERARKSRGDMCKDLGVSYTTFTDWVKGNTYPRIDKIEAMANYFGISKSDLVEKKPTPVSESGPSDPLDAQLMDLLRQATPEQKKAWIALLESKQPHE